MKRIYSCDLKSKSALLKILEADPYSDNSFARTGYILREGKILNEDPTKLFVFFSAHDSFVSKADEKLKTVPSIAILEGEAAHRIVAKIEEMENNAQAGLGLFD